MHKVVKDARVRLCVARISVGSQTVCQGPHLGPHLVPTPLPCLPSNRLPHFCTVAVVPIGLPAILQSAAHLKSNFGQAEMYR